MPKNNNFLDDKQIITDALNSQKFMTSNYNLSANECVDNSIKNEFIEILTEEHAIQNELLQELSKRGWTTNTIAQTKDIIQVKQEFVNASNKL